MSFPLSAFKLQHPIDQYLYLVASVIKVNCQPIVATDFHVVLQDDSSTTSMSRKRSLLAQLVPTLEEDDEIELFRLSSSGR